MILSILGLLGGVCFAWAGVPTAWRCFKLGNNPGVPVTMAWLIFSGTVLVYSYLVLKFFVHTELDAVLTVNYSVEAASWATILRYTYLPRTTT